MSECGSPVICFYMHFIIKTNIPSAHLRTLTGNLIISYTLLVPDRIAGGFVYMCAGFKDACVQTCDSADLWFELVFIGLPVAFLFVSALVPPSLTPTRYFSSPQLLLLLFFGSLSENP